MNISNRLMEAFNGIQLVLVFWMLFFGVLHLHYTWERRTASFRGKGGRFRALRAMYHENKPEIALMTMMLGFWLSNNVLWFDRYSERHGFDVAGFDENSAFVFVLTRLLMLIGVSCWIRVISPFPKAYLVWTGMVAVALAFGFGMAAF